MNRKIKQAAVIGAGVMGGGIAALLAAAGVKTLLLDIVPFDLTDEQKADSKARNRIVRDGLKAARNAQPALFMHPADVARVDIGNLEDDFEKLAQCDWIVEVVVENLKVKQELLARIEKVRKPGSIISSNTSGIPLKAMSEHLGSDFKQHFLGTHFFNPVRYMKLLEIIPGEETLPEILDFMADYGERLLGKGIVWAKDTPNFVGNRIGVHSIVKTMQLMVSEGMTIPEVDTLFGPVMGRPKTGMFKTADLVGLDTMGHVARNTYDLVVDDEQRDSFVLPAFVNQLIEKKMLGKKTGSGFYKTDLTPEWKRVRKVLNPETFEYETYTPPQFECLDAAKQAKTPGDKMRAVVYGNDRGAAFAWKAVAANLIYAANRIPEITDTIVEMDNALKWGFNLGMGPFESWDAIGVAEAVAKMEADDMPVPAGVKEMLAAGHSSFYKVEEGQRYYYDFGAKAYKAVVVSPKIISLESLRSVNKVALSCPSAVLVDLGQDVFCLEFRTKMNSLNAEVITFMSEALDWVDQNGAGMVIGNQAGGMPGAFTVGADLKQVAEGIHAKRFDDIEMMVKQLQDTLQKTKYAAFPVVAAPYGMALGGGCEISLAADRIVAHCELYMGLVEIGVGLLPAGCGCLNLFQKFIRNIPPAVTDVDLAKFFVPVFMNIAMAKVSTSAADARANGMLGPVDRIVFNRDYLIGEAKKEVLKMVDEGYAPPVKGKVQVFGEAAQGMINAEIENMRRGKLVSDYDAHLAKRIAYVISGGEVRTNGRVDEDVILTLEREAFVEFTQQEKTLARIEHTLKTGKPLRN